MFDLQIFKYFSEIIEKEMGIKYDDSIANLLENRLVELSKMQGFADLPSFWQSIKSQGLSSAQKELLLDMATNNETSFFRDPAVFDFFRDHFLKSLENSNQKIKIWSAACSTGQEPYSLAMIFAELALLGKTYNYEILASDFSERVLNQTKEGIYSHLQIQRGLSSLMLIKYFDQIKNDQANLPKYQIKSELKKNLTFSRINLIEPWKNIGPFDIIFCRNVLIYQPVENKIKIIAKMANMLIPGGFLVLGSAESMVGLSKDFELQIFGNACAYALKKEFSKTG